MVLLAGAKFVLTWCFFGGAPPMYLFNCFSIGLLEKKMLLLAGAKFVLIWRFFFKMVLLAGAKFAHAAAAAQSRRKMT